MSPLAQMKRKRKLKNKNEESAKPENNFHQAENVYLFQQLLLVFN